MRTQIEDNPMVPKLIGWGGIAIVVGGIFVAFEYVFHLPDALPTVVASQLWFIVHVGFMLSLFGGVFALFAFLRVSLRRGDGLTGVLACTLAVISLISILGFDYAEVFIFPTLAVEFPEVILKYGDGTLLPSIALAFPISGVIFLVGYTLFSYELGNRQCIFKESAFMLMVGIFIFSVGLSGRFPMLILRLGSVLFGIGLIWTGLSLRTRISEIEQ